MTQYVVSYDVDYEENKATEYNRTRDAVVKAIEKHDHCIVLDTFYRVHSELDGKALRDKIVSDTDSALKGKASMKYHLAVYEATGGWFHNAKSGVLDCVRALLNK